MFFGFDTKAFKDWLKGASLTDIEYQVNWCKEVLKEIGDGLISPNEDMEKYLSTFIHNCEQELKRRKHK
jgi:hypothetical protein